MEESMTTAANPRTLKNEVLADRTGALNSRIAGLEAELKLLKAEFMRRGFAVLDGKKFRLTRVDAVDYKTLDAELIKQAHSTEWLATFSKDAHRDPYCLIGNVTGSRVTKPVKAAAKILEPA
jgi:hypothetical protein